MESFFAGILLLFLAAVVFALPIIAFVTAMVASSSVSRLKTKIDAIEKNLDLMRKKMMSLEKGREMEPIKEPEENAAVAEDDAVQQVPQIPVPVQKGPPSDLLPEPVKEPESPKKEEEEGGTVEELLSAKLFVWLGAIALLLATIFLIKYSFDKGWVTPPLRAAMGYFFGIVFLALGEYLTKRSNYVSQGFSSAGIGVIYASTLAAVNLYHLISPLIGFGIMSLATLTAIALSIQRGPVIAVIGMLGGFLTPYWLKTGTPRPQALFSYLFLLELALLYTARKKKWLALAFFAVSGGFLWVVTWFSSVFTGSDSAWIGLFLLASTAALLLFTFTNHYEDEKKPAVNYFFQILFAGIACVLMAVLCAKANYSNEEWVFFGILALGTVIFGHLKEEFKIMPFISLVISSVLFLTWPLDGLQALRYTAVIAAFGVLFALSGYVVSFISKSPQFWALLSSYASIQLLLIAYFKVKPQLSEMPWGWTALVLSLIFAVFAYTFMKKDERSYKSAIGWMAAASSIQLSLAIAFSFKEAWWSAGWGIAGAFLLYIAYRYEIRPVQIIAICLTAATMARLVLNPYVFKYPTGETPVFNWLLYGYGIPLLAFVISSRIAFKSGEKKLSALWQVSSTLLSLALGVLQIHHILNDGRIDVPVSTLWEWGWIVSYSLCIGLMACFLSERFSLKVLKISSAVVVMMTALVGGAVIFLFQNPLFSHQFVGRNILLNRLVLIYLVPSLLLMVIGSRLKSGADGLYLRTAAHVFAFILFVVFATFEIRQVFQGEYLDGTGITNPEKYTYSIVFMLLGISLALTGMLTENKFARYSSLALMLAVIFKVFLYDVSALKGILRPLSFFGLGFSLLLLAYLYRKFVFGLGRK